MPALIERFDARRGSSSPGTVAGFVLRYGQLSGDRGGYRVRLEPGSLRMPTDRDVRALYSHDETHILGRTGNGTLRLEDTADGLAFELDLPATSVGRDVAELLRRGDVSGMSFGTYPVDMRWEMQAGEEVMVYEAFELDEVTITGNPAFGDTLAELVPAESAEAATYAGMFSRTPIHRDAGDGENRPQTFTGRPGPSNRSVATTAGEQDGQREQRADQGADQGGEQQGEQGRQPNTPAARFAADRDRARELVDHTRADGRQMTAEERKEFDRLRNRMEAFMENQDAERQIAEFERAGRSQRVGEAGEQGDDQDQRGTREERQAFNRARDLATSGAGPVTGGRGDDDAQLYREHAGAVEEFMRTGRTDALQRFAQRQARGGREEFITTTGSNGGILLPVNLEANSTRRSSDAYRLALAARGVPVRRATSTDSVRVITEDDEGNTAEVIAEDASADNPLDPDRGATLLLPNRLHRGKTQWFSNTELATTLDLLQFVETRQDRRIDRLREADFSTKILANATNVVTGSSTTGITYQEVLELKYTIRPADRMYGVFVISDGLAQALEGLEDSEGRPLYVRSIKDGGVDFLAGWPVIPAESLPAPAANAKTLIAATAEALHMIDVVSGRAAPRMARYENLPTHPDQVGFQKFANGDANFEDYGVAVFRQAAS